MKLLDVKNLSFSYDGEKDVLRDINFSIQEGDYVSIIGHNGSGKSTLAKLLIGLLKAQKGEIKIGDMLLNEENVYDVREHIAIVFQNPDNQFIGSTVRDDIAFGLENRCVPSHEMDAIIEEAATKVGMEDFLDHEPSKLSGGQKQRVAIAGVLAMKPDILILDEATSMLDPQGRQEVNDLVHDLRKEKAVTILSITHDIEEVVNSDQVLVLNEGRLRLKGRPEEVLTKVNRMKRFSLDVPFSLKLHEALAKEGIRLEEKFLLESMVEEICQLNSKK